MKQVIQEGSSRPIKIWTDTVEESALNQLKNLARLPFIAANGVACMPDVHAGIGSTVGTVIATRKALIPAAVGVDLGCGMVAVRTSLKATDLPDSLNELRLQIERDVPLGPGGKHQRDQELENNYDRMPVMPQGMQAEMHQIKKGWLTHSVSQLGTLGSGNHFIEICLDEKQDVWIMLHSGSRGIGNLIGSYYISKAKEAMLKYHIDLPDPNLAYLPEKTPDFDSYVKAMMWAQDYALENRKVMLEAVIQAMKRQIPTPFTIEDEAISCHHNYTEKENHFGENLWITRKGAIRARENDLGIIPGSMGQRSFIVRGKGNPQSYCSCSHGAGRIMSRTQARKVFTVTDLRNQTEGVECRKDNSVLDEIPSAYKDIDEVMANQLDLVEVIHTLKQVLCVKGG